MHQGFRKAALRRPPRERAPRRPRGVPRRGGAQRAICQLLPTVPLLQIRTRPDAGPNTVEAGSLPSRTASCAARRANIGARYMPYTLYSHHPAWVSSPSPTSASVIKRVAQRHTSHGAGSATAGNTLASCSIHTIHVGCRGISHGHQPWRHCQPSWQAAYKALPTRPVEGAGSPHSSPGCTWIAMVPGVGAY